MPYRVASLDAHRIHPSRARIATIAIAATLLVSSCGSDASDDPSPTDPLSTTPIAEGEGGGVPLEPGSNLPPSASDTTPSDSTVGSDFLAPPDSLGG